MKKRLVKVIPFCILWLIVIALTSNPTMMAMSENKKTKVDEILEQNKDNVLLTNTVYDNKVRYMEFMNNDVYINYIIDNTTGEEQPFEYFIKPEKQEEFNQKIDTLISTKYPKFIADILIENKNIRSYRIEEDKLIITFDKTNLNIETTEELSLNVYYNEIKDYLDFTMHITNDYEIEDGYQFDKNKKTVALTFDDGPNGERTNKIVEILKNNKAHATFFMVGNKMESGREVIQNVLVNGNEIGSHSYAHKSMKRQKLNDVIAGEEQTNAIYKSITGKDLIYTRPPYGSISAQIRESLNTIFINWDLDTEDWLYRDKEHIVNYVLENVNDGDIILMHDSYDSTVEAVEDLLPKLYNLGYNVVSISELAELQDITLEMHTVYRNIKRSLD